MNFKEIIKTNLKNIPGKHIKKKYVVIECDDWGGIRMPSKTAHEKMIKSGLNIKPSRYDYDTLASSEDLQILFECLEQVKDSKGNSAIITAVCNMTNPDFDKIKESGYKHISTNPLHILWKSTTIIMYLIYGGRGLIEEFFSRIAWTRAYLGSGLDGGAKAG